MVSYIIDGGIGKNIMFTAMINELSKNEDINIVTAYPDIFYKLKGINKVFEHPMMNSKKFIECTSKVEGFDPYKSNILIQPEKHLLEHWCNGYRIDYEKIDSRPRISELSEEVQKEVKKALDNIKGDFIIVQFTGGQSPLGFNPKESKYNQGTMHFQRNYPMPYAHKLVQRIKEKYPDLNIINYSLPNEHDLIPGTERISIPYIGYKEVIQKAKAYIGIDSSLLHIAASTDTPGIGLWGGVPYWQFSWEGTEVLTNFKGNVKEFDPFDPHYISIDTKKILKELEKIWQH